MCSWLVLASLLIRGLFRDIDFGTYYYMMTDIISVSEHAKVDTILSLVTDMIQHMMQFGDDLCPMNHPGCFLKDLEYLDCILLEFRFQDNPQGQNPKNTKVLQKSILKLRNALSKARETVLRSWSMRSNPIIVYLKLFDGRLTLKELFSIPIADTLSNLLHCRDILTFQNLKPIEPLTEFTDNHVLLDSDRPFQQEDWGNHRISLTHYWLKAIRDGGDETPDLGGKPLSFGSDHDWIKIVVFRRFFDDEDGIWNIRTKKSFENPYNLALLQLVADHAAWARSLPLQTRTPEELRHVAGPSILCWFNRLLVSGIV